MANPMTRRRYQPNNRRSKPTIPTTNESETNSTLSHEIFDECEKLKQKLLSLPNGNPETRFYRQELLDQYNQLILVDLDFAIEKKIEHDLWTIIFKNEISSKQDQVKENHQHPIKRAEIQTSLQTFYEYARGYYIKLLQDVVHSYNFENSICKLTFPFLQRRSLSSYSTRQCKEASMLYFIQHILVHVGDLNRYSNHIDLAKTFYQYAIQTIPCLGQPYNQIAILHEMKNPLSLLTPGQNQLITVYYYVRSIAIKVTFPLAISNLDKLFQRLKDFPLSRYEQTSPHSEFLTLFLQIIAMINLESNLEGLQPFLDLFRKSIIKNFHQSQFIQMISILMFTLHRTLSLLPRATPSKQPEIQFNLALQVLILILEQCLEVIQLPLSMMVVDEQHILPIVYLTFAYLANIFKSKTDLFDHPVFKQKPTMWNSLAKLLRSFGVYATNLEMNKDKNQTSGSLFNRYSDYPLTEERTLECFTPLNEILKAYNFKKYDNNDTASEELSEKDERQLRKLRLVAILRTLSQKVDEKTKNKLFEHLITYVKDDVVYFESSSLPTIPQVPTSNFGVPGDRRTIQKPSKDEGRMYNSNGAVVKTPRGGRNVALRQFFEPAMAAAESASKDRLMSPSHSSNDPVTNPPPPPHLLEHPGAWPQLSSVSEPRNLFHAQSLDPTESRFDSVWRNTVDPKDQFSFQPSSSPQQILAPGLMLPNSLTKPNFKP
ncbi:unnamed protein product [Adineta ricciae]|uniref:Protein SMG7 n=1 Tax=Adineta ricciae TaxID=249248 RepID=A0A814JMM1_ADIRI|nr:unnamed protein product [Adineta ricciae]CAF1322804.1 unnamed protein product [Adineta ricciae]